jgi:hypothetical protein
MKHITTNKVSNHATKAALFVDLAHFDETGSMATVTNKQVHSSDIVRRKQFDSSSKQMNPSLLRGPGNVTSSYQEIDREEYCSPCDRVGRFYTKSAAGLTLKEAAKVAKQMNSGQKPPKKIIGFALAATAPDAFKATLRIAEIAGNGTMRMPQKLKKEQITINLPSVSSPLAQREGHRLLRSEPSYNTIKPTLKPQTDSPPGFNSSNDTGFGARNFDNWEPEALDTELDDNQQLELFKSAITKIDLKAKANERFNAAVDVVVRTGVITAGGSGNRAAIPSMNHTALNSIIARIPSIFGFLGIIDGGNVTIILLMVTF